MLDHRFTGRWLSRLAVLAFLIGSSGHLAASTGEGGTLSPVSVQKGPKPPANPPPDPSYDYWIADGLYATITAFSSFEEPKIEDESKLKLKKIPGFAKDLKVRVLWQKRQAPLAVLLLGMATRSKAPLAQLWKSYMFEAGCHVLTFDSAFLPAFTERSRHGVAGNVREEALLIGHLVETFLKQKKARGKITKVGVVGASYGATLALALNGLVREGKFGFALDRVLAFSPPVSMRMTAALLDKFHREDRWDYTLVELGGDLMGHKPVPRGQPVPFTAAEMRAGIAAAFRMDLADVVEGNDRLFKMKRLPRATAYDDQYRKDVAGAWTFTRYVERMAYPYWREKGRVGTLDELWGYGVLVNLLASAREGMEVVIAKDDPLNDPKELDDLVKAVNAGVLTILPRGGHMGYVGSRWAKARMLALFK